MSLLVPDKMKKPRNKPLTAILIGAGQRGVQPFGAYARANPDQLKIVGVVEPNDQRRTRFSHDHNIPASHQFENVQAMYKNGKLADLVFNASPDRFHVSTTLPAIAMGYHILLEKPIAQNMEQLTAFFRATQNAAEQHLWVMHELRQSPYFKRVKQLISSKTIGDLVTLLHTESPAFWHMAHSYVRGNWSIEAENAPFLITKACHDLDLLTWFLDRPANQIQSFGSLTEFRTENAPPGAPERCTDGCPVAATCPYDAQRLYLGANTGWPVSVISSDVSVAARLKALQTGPYGRCVYHCDNDVLDHQIVNIEFEEGVTVAFTLTGHGPENTRKFAYDGTRGHLSGDFERGELTHWEYPHPVPQMMDISCTESGHGGGDSAMIEAFLNAVKSDATPDNRGLAQGLYAHILGFAAEESRKSGCVVNLTHFGREMGAALWTKLLQAAFPGINPNLGQNDYPTVGSGSPGV